MRCLRCQRLLGESERVASMSGSINGDEHTDVYFLCPHCGVYTVGRWWDDFTGVESESVDGPLAREEGDARVALIRGCATPWDKKCRCPAHRAYFGDGLD